VGVERGVGARVGCRCCSCSSLMLSLGTRGGRGIQSDIHDGFAFLAPVTPPHWNADAFLRSPDPRLK